MLLADTVGNCPEQKANTTQTGNKSGRGVSSGQCGMLISDARPLGPLLLSPRTKIARTSSWRKQCKIMMFSSFHPSGTETSCGRKENSMHDSGQSQRRQGFTENGTRCDFFTRIKHMMRTAAVLLTSSLCSFPIIF